MPALEHDFIIIGQGLAGSVLAHTLMKRGLRVLVIDNTHSASASSVAAGIVNPVTGHRLNITERFEEYFPKAERYYQDLYADIGKQVWQPVKQTRSIKNQGQNTYLAQRQKEAPYTDLLGQNPDPVFASSDYGEIEVLKTAIVDVPALLEGMKTYLASQQAYTEAKVDYPSIIRTKSKFQIGDAYTKNLIFCEGYQAIYNPWLQHLPFKLAKGEILSIEATPRHSNTLLSWGNWLACCHGRTKLGSNFAWNDLTLSPDPAIKEKLLTSLSEHTNIAGRVIDHQVGIRPATAQRKPFIGAIPQLEGAYCFNGFGSKGCLLIPFYAELFTQCFVEKRALPAELSQWI